MAIRRCPFRLNKWKEFSREIERAVDEISHLDSEIKKLETRNNPVAAGAPAGTEARNHEARSRRRRHPARTEAHA